MSSFPIIFADDFNNADEKGTLRLNCAGTVDDLAKYGIRLEEGMRSLAEIPL